MISRNKRVSIAVVLGIGILVNYFDRVNLSVAHDALQSAFGISDIVFGYLLGAYSWTYAMMQLPSGSLLDRFGVRRIMLVSILLWAIASGLAAVAPTILFLFAARFLLGIGEAPTFPACAKAIGLWFPPNERGVPTATFDAAAKLSIGLGTPILGLILLRFGMRANFAATAILSILYALLFAFTYRDPAVRQNIDPAENKNADTGRLRLSDLLRQRKILGAALGSGAYNYCFYLLLTWMPFYLQKGLKMTSRQAVLWSAVPWLVAAFFGFAVGGMLTDSLIRRGHDAGTVRKTILLIGTGMGLFVLAPAFLRQPQIVLVCLSLALSGLAAASPILWTLPSLLAPPASTGRVGAIMNQSNQLAAIVAPVATGYITTGTHSFDAAFFVAGIILLIGIASYVFLLGRIEQIPFALAKDQLAA
ncbi:MFS transporter [Edaphobacter modestus]|uniref:Sugar phosphate permease n=1 Tax=Edaphobacter modestus TaxID=388466 RepID=A0A4Q7YQG9_9BACT|nr:MFS transporter [Edaphobacter modestus]RZU39404.1 sugar phosphate permease [Edaphobacter modestus]